MVLRFIVGSDQRLRPKTSGQSIPDALLARVLMRFIVRKFVDADTAKEALDKEASVPVHDIYLKDGEEPKRDNSPKDCVGFIQGTDPNWRSDEVIAKKR
jgi:hypothetical protein